MKNWNDMIEARRHKEKQIVEISDLKLSTSDYDRSVSAVLGSLSGLERSAIKLRFLCNLSIGRVADRMGMSWDGADALIDQAVKKIAQELLKTRNQSQAVRQKHLVNRAFALLRICWFWLTERQDLDLGKFEELERKKTVREWTEY